MYVQIRFAKLSPMLYTHRSVILPVPAVEKIVYSTCSVHAAENEDVVCQALASDEAHTGKFILADREDVLPTWPRRGIQDNMGEYKSRTYQCNNP